jgi:hypothetical protein
MPAVVIKSSRIFRQTRLGDDSSWPTRLARRDICAKSPDSLKLEWVSVYHSPFGVSQVGCDRRVSSCHRGVKGEREGGCLAWV